ncbi:MAG: hypothetical protein LAT63_05960 [Marinobacter sp.]|nr:hypothetical protein [Marinobacter sp.]
MKRTKLATLVTVSLAMTPPVWGLPAGLQPLDDRELSAVSAQSGVNLELNLRLTTDAISYFDDGNGIHLEGFNIGSASQPGAPAFHKVKIDINADASLSLDYLVQDRRIEVTDIRLANAPEHSMGGIFMDHDITGNLRLAPGGHSGQGYTLDSQFSMRNGRLGYRTNGNEVFLDGVSLDVNAPGMTLDSDDNSLLLRAPTVDGQFDIAAIRYSNNPANRGVSRDANSGAWLPSYGQLQGDFQLSQETRIRGEGRFGQQGLRIDSDTQIHHANLSYLTNGHALTLRNISGHLAVDDLRIDVTQDWHGRDALALTLHRLAGNLDIERLEMGADQRSIGAVNFSFLFADQVINGRAYSNAFYLQGGGHPDAGLQGLRIASQWSLKNADLAFTDDGNKIIFSGLQSWGQGDITVNVTRDGTLGDTRFYDGLRIGFEGVEGGYRLNGLRVGDPDAPLQGGTELLLALGIYPAYDFELDGHITLGAGGPAGEGLVINSDIRIRNGNAALIATPYNPGEGDVTQKGLWATDLSYDMHLRNMTLGMTEEGLAIIKGEAWSTMDVGNLRLGSKDDSRSFGRFVLQRYETGSSMVISPGGAGNLCVGGSGNSAAACAASGGSWEMRGEEGITVALRNILAQAVDETRRNRFVWETHRQLGPGGKPINDTGVKLVLNDIYTSDGTGDGSNTFGIQTDIALDVYQTRVVKKQDGPDSQGVFGLKGDERIMDTSAAAGYRYVSNPSAADRANRPLGFAVQAHTRFKELNIGNIDLVHPQGGAATAIYGAKLQNLDLRANLTATPIP